MDTIWVLGDQLNRRIASLDGVEPGEARILMVESTAKLASKRWHVQRAHLVITAMRRFAAELEAAGFDVDHRRAASLRAGLREHVDAHGPQRVIAMEPMSWDGLRLLEDLEVDVVPSNQFLCHRDEFAAWAGDRPTTRMEDFYRWQRRRLGYLMDGDEPAGGRWNFDHDNRERPPGDPDDGSFRPEEAVVASALDAVDDAVLRDLPDGLFGSSPDGTWATSRQRAFARMHAWLRDAAPMFGDYQDAMVGGRTFLNHSLLSHALNVGLVLPGEVCDAVEEAYRAGELPINAAEGFIRQVIGWREYVWGVYWREMPGYRDLNVLGADRPLPPVFTGAQTEMACAADAVRSVHDHAYAHHIQRLMVIANLCLLAGVRPAEVVDWMWASFIDGAEWVMLPNVIGMGLFADGGIMSTKPYAAGGAYINRMSDHCSGCRFDPRKRTGDDACPFTTLYWDFLARHRDRFEANHRMRRSYATYDRLADRDELHARATEVLRRLERGEL